MSAQGFDSIFEIKTLEVIQLEKITEEADNNQNNTTECVNPNEIAVDFKVTNFSRHNSAKDETPKTHDDHSFESNKITPNSLDEVPYFINSSQIETRSPVNMISLKDSNKEMAYNNIDREFCLSELSVVKSDKSKQSLESSVKSNPDINIILLKVKLKVYLQSVRVLFNIPTRK